MIDTKKGFVPRKGKVYLLSREKREEVYKFISEQLKKEYIRFSKLPQMALVFFIGKKDGKKQMVQDYMYLNEWTVKNNYPLPLILDIIENIDTKKVLQTLFSLYLHNQWTYFHKLSCAGKPQMRAICTYMGCTKATTNY